MNLELEFEVAHQLNFEAKQAESITSCKRKGVAASVWNPDGDRVLFVTNGPRHYPCLGGEHIAGCGCMHAEALAIIKLMSMPYFGDAAMSLTMLCSYSPCFFCSNLIAESSLFKRVYYGILTKYDPEKHFENILDSAGVDVVHVNV